MKEQESNSTPSSFLEVFLSKLKEQSFTIVLMLGVIYFQNKMFRERIEHHEVNEAKQELLIETLNKEQKSQSLEREKYLIEQRDFYVEKALESKNK
tara:strand:+ start:2127 stop:2414 length:288 start_codon:yes stop_codon:yes gene_type:complete